VHLLKLENSSFVVISSHPILHEKQQIHTIQKMKVKTALIKNLIRLSWLELDTAQATKSECSMKQQ